MTKNKLFEIIKPTAGLMLFFSFIYFFAAFANYLGYGIIRSVQPSVFCLPTLSTNSEKAEIMYKAGAIKDTTELIRYIRNINPGDLKAGRYLIDDKITYKQLIRKLVMGEQEPVNMTFTASRSLEDIAKKLSLNIEQDSARVLQALRSDSISRVYGFDTLTVWSMYIPNTYEVYWNITADSLVSRLNEEYEAFWSYNDREARREALNLTRNEVITLASIVYEESKNAYDMRLVASVYLNRLRRKMRLQADPTVKYAVGDWTLSRVLYKHLEKESPYNTYKVYGLPPSPIVVPSIDAIEAVLENKKTSYLYFVASPNFDGSHVFANNLVGHNQNVSRFRVAYRQRMANARNEKKR